MTDKAKDLEMSDEAYASWLRQHLSSLEAAYAKYMTANGIPYDPDCVPLPPIFVAHGYVPTSIRRDFLSGSMSYELH